MMNWTSCGRMLCASLLLASQALPTASARAQTSSALTVDFDAAMNGLRFNPKTVDANLDATDKGNGMLDADEMALVSAVLANPSLSLKATNGVNPGAVRAAFDQAKASAQTDLKTLLATYPTAPEVVAGYVLLGKGSFDSYNAMSAGFGAPLKSDYSLALQLGRWLAFDGDADGDGVRNIDEYKATIAQGRAAYVKAALDPAVKPSAAQIAAAATPTPQPSSKKVLGVILYPGFEVLDVFGPVEMWSYVPEFQVVMVSEKGGAVRSFQGVEVMSQYSFANAPPLDILMVPGGVGTRTELLNPVFLDYIKTQDKRTEVTTSVCTGSALLAKAGLLKGHKATSNKGAFSLAVDQDPTVEWIGKARWVDDGKFVTSSGVSAGTDMALGLVQKLFGKARAQGLARSLEYEWHEDPTVDPFAREVPKPTTR
ncbi:MAG: DJ-1/PfpI family protein [Vicinamibacterales bacterium]